VVKKPVVKPAPPKPEEVEAAKEEAAVDDLFNDEPEEKFVFEEEDTVIVDGVIDYSQFDPDLAAKIAS